MSDNSIRKKQLEEELKEIQRQEAIDIEKKERQDLLDKGFYTPLKSGKITSTIWYCSEYDFKEISDGYYTSGQILGAPNFKKGDEVVLINCQGCKTWYKKQDNGDYLYIDENEYGIEEGDLEFITDIK